MKKILTILLALVLMTAFPLNALATTPESGEKLLYTDYYSSTLYISGNTATCISSLTGYKGETTQIVIGQTLQKRDSSGNWTSVKYASATINNYRGTLTKTYTGLSSGTYRLKSSFIVYAGSYFETLLKYSAQGII